MPETNLKQQLEQLDADPQDIEQAAREMEADQAQQVKHPRNHALRLDTHNMIVEISGSTYDIVVDEADEGGLDVWIKGMEGEGDIVI